MELTGDSTASLPISPLQPVGTAATTIWHYKYTNATLFGNVMACNTMLMYEYQMKRCWTGNKFANLGKCNTNATSQTQDKIQLQPVTNEKWALPLFQSTGLKAATTEPFPRSQKLDNCYQMCWSPVSREHPGREENYDDIMPQCDTCQRTYHWKCLNDLSACLCTESGKPRKTW
jgi:hypothetical protein